MIANKNLGQHFLHDENICRKITASFVSDNPQRVLEIGPGFGALTKYLITYPLDFICVEIDKNKRDFLSEKFSENISIVNKDILQMEIPFAQTFSIIGNLPYNISSPILFKIFEWYSYIHTCVFMLQKEVAERICSPHNTKNYGILSVLLNTFFLSEYLFDITPNSFTPKPKVKSAVIKLTTKKNYHFFENFQAFKKMVKVAFSKRRKVLRNNLKDFYSIKNIDSHLLDKRPEQLEVKDYTQLFTFLKS